MAERSTWPETHLNAVNKLLCWDCSFLGKATRPAATSHIPTSRAVHLGVRWERQVGWEAKEKKSSSFGYCGRRRKGSVSLREPLGNPQVGAITKLWSTPSLAYHQSTRELKKKRVTPMQMCQRWAVKGTRGRANFTAERVYKDKEISDKTEKCTRIDCCQLGAC